MRRALLTHTIAIAGIGLLGLASAHPSLAATGAWSPRASRYVPVWTRAGAVPVRTEIATAAPVKRRSAPRKAISNHAFWSAGQVLTDQRSNRRSPTSERAHLVATAAARFRPSALPDRRARSAVVAALAGVFHEAHAPPFLS